MSSKSFLWTVGTWILIHILFLWNIRYTVKLDDITVLKNVNKDTYERYYYRRDVAGLDKGAIIENYFGIFPDWTAYLIFAGYFVIAFMTLYNDVNKKV